MAVPCDMLLHPELLTNEQILQIIQERHLRVENLHLKDRYGLLELFHQYCVPYGQRTQRESPRGKTTKEYRTFNSESRNLDAINNNSQHKRKKILLSGERLKPPPDVLSGHMKRIKLECNNTSVIKRKMSIDDVDHNPPPKKKERKPITWP